MSAFSDRIPALPWGINFGAGANSTALMIEARRRGMVPDWIVFADTGSELPETLAHVERMREWCAGWRDLTVVRWIRQDGTFEPVHAEALRTHRFPAKWYGFAGCTSKWKIQPMDKWRKQNGFQAGCYAVGYDAGEKGRIKRACQRAEDPNFFAWYPLVAWGIDRFGCEAICRDAGFEPIKSACWCCPNTKPREWRALKRRHPDLFQTMITMRDNALADGENPQAGMVAALDIEGAADDSQTCLFDLCAHGSCFT